MGKDTNSDGIADYYEADVESARDYYPFGMTQPGREYTSNAYRYGFNTQEMANEVANDHYTAQYWEYDARLGRKWNVDPKPIANESEYAVNRNNSVSNTDPSGDCPNGDCPQINAKLTAKINIGGKGGISGSVGFGIGLNYKPAKFLSLGIGGSGSLNFGGLGTSSSTSPLRLDYGGTVTVTGGLDKAGAQSLQTINSIQPSGILNTMKYSGTLGANFLSGTDNRSQITGYTGFRIGNFSFGHANDVFFGTDQYWGAETNVKMGTEGGPNIAIWNEVYNGPRKSGITPNDPIDYERKDWRGNKYKVQIVRQDAKGISLNSGRTFISMNLPVQSGGVLNLSFGSEGGWNMGLQRILHYGKQYPQFNHDTKESNLFFGTGLGF